ncbi:hypothetical protein J7T55_001850 [Diaporthe amygdali]|uniref:uncharacterized protein n=1 Tax=Phomopsis amygdali TaxID=1214568 RepID=UPI0022FE03BD|nr:uncharacterized protein J7T55_001850 [Diaporthe amygdali]KAJ0117651.1 hypothetical protein J7T55_001850 [Diaporthe amygdali]
MMATPKGAGLSRNRRVTTYSKAFGRRSRPEEKGKDGRSVTAPLESSTIWDFQDDDEINSPVVTLPTKPKFKQYGRKIEQKTRRVSEVSPKPAVAQAKALPNPKRRKTSPSHGDSRGFRARAYSTPPSPPPSLPSPPHEAMPPPKTVPKTTKPKSILRVSSAGSAKTSQKDTAMKDSAAKSVPFSPAIPKNLKTFSINKTRKELVQTQIPFRPGQTPRSIPGARQEKASTSKVSPTTGDSQRQHGSATRKRKRLIDELAAQADESSDDDDDSAEWSQNLRRTPEPQDLPTFPSTPEPKIPKSFGRPDSAKKRSGPKVTYSARRTLLAEGSSTGGLETVDEDAWLKEPLLPTGGSQFDMDDDDDDEPFTKGAVRSIHELRQAGANSRFADEIEDLLARIGRPSGKTTSSRRNALVELSQKMSDKSFVRKFRDHNGDRSLFEQVGRETDIIAGYALVAILTTLLASTASTHIMSQLQGQGLSLLLKRLLAIPADIQPISKDSTSNLSRNGQQAMSKLKASLLILPIWEPTTPFMLSPRRLALKALELVVKHSGSVESELFSLEVTDQLFSLLADASEPDSWKYPRTDESIDFHLALTLLESYSVQAMQTESKDRWTFKHLPIIADTLGTTLRRSNGRLGEVGLLVLKLTLNTANNNHDAATAFIEKGTVRTLANALCDTFQTATAAIDDADVFNSHLEALLLMLGVMINFSEHDRNTGGALLSALDDSQAPLDRLIRLFLDHHAATSEADSVEKSQLNVAFGYLSLLLGYMSLYEPVRKRFSSMHKAGNLAPLLESIREFIAYHRMTDDAIAQAGDGQAPLYSSFTTKLQGLVERLESYA